jgi:hypothetical protein
VEGEEAGEVAHHVGHAEDHVPGAAVLIALPVHLQPQAQVLRVGHLVLGDQPGPDGAEGVAALALVPKPPALELELPLRDVVDHAIPGHVFQGFLEGDVPGPPADDHAQLHLPVGLARATGDHQVVIGPRDGAGGLEEDHRLRGDGRSGFLGVVTVVEADADELAHAAEAGANAGGSGYGGKGLGVQGPQALEAFGQGSGVEVFDQGREVAHPPLPVQDARLFPTRLTVAH